MQPEHDGTAAPERPYDPDDITTWDAEQLDELAVWAAVAEQGNELVDELPDGLPTAPHGINTPEDHDFTAGGDFDPYDLQREP